MFRFVLVFMCMFVFMYMSLCLCVCFLSRKLLVKAAPFSSPHNVRLVAGGPFSSYTPACAGLGPGRASPKHARDDSKPHYIFSAVRALSKSGLKATM